MMADIDWGSVKPVKDTSGIDWASAKPLVKPNANRIPETAMPWSNVPGQALRNIPSSAMGVGQGIYQAVRHPLETGKQMLGIGAGSLRNAMPASVSGAIDKLDWNPQAGQQASNVADTAHKALVNRYGGVEQLKNTLATDPVGAASDIAALLSGGEALGIKGASKLTSLTNPVNLASKVAGKVGKFAGESAAEAIGGLGTHTGAMPLKEAFMAGKTGGEAAKAFTENMRGRVPITDVLDMAKSNLEEMRIAKSEAYKTGMMNVANDKTVLDFKGIRKSLKDAWSSTSYKGVPKNESASRTLKQINDEISKWQNMEPKEFHTPEGLDALKQRVGGIVESIPYEEKTARMVGNKVYHAIKNEIVKQAPTYSKTMKSYSDAMDQITEIEKTLSLGSKASADTAIRKLQSLMRNNVNTNYGRRVALAKQLEQQGGQRIIPSLAGQSLNKWTPRGLGGVVAGGLGLGGYEIGGPHLAAAMLAAQSPRLMGETAYALGRGSKALGMTNANAVNALSALGRAGQNRLPTNPWQSETGTEQ
jgi:hypothetical protein